MELETGNADMRPPRGLTRFNALPKLQVAGNARQPTYTLLIRVKTNLSP